MKKNYLFILGLCLLGMTSCVEKDFSDVAGVNKTANTFDFSTSANTNVSISYAGTPLATKTYFEIYDENPIEWTETSYNKKENVKPLFCGYTDNEGEFAGKVEIPLYAKTIYIYSPSTFATALMIGEVVDGSVTISNKTDEPQSVKSRAASTYTTRAVSAENWKTYLGSWNNSTGRISYVFSETSSDLFVSTSKAQDLMQIHSSTFNVRKPCPNELRTSKDLRVSISDEDKAKGVTGAEVAIALLGGNTCWSSSLGYYYYKDGEQPNSYEEIKDRIILVVPNTQDGCWDNNVRGSRACQGIDRGTNVQLFYYGEDVKQSQKSSEFPDGTRIGFVLFSHAWGNNALGCNRHEGNQMVISSTTPNCNKGSRKYTQGSGCAMYTADNENVLMSFEDHDDDENFSDVVFTMSTNPIGAFTDVNVSTGTTTETTMKNGIYCFEDLWPNRGDYDFNDVMVNSSASKEITNKVTTTVSKIELSSYCTAENFVFSIYKNHATKKNGLAFTIEQNEYSPSDATYSMTIDGEPATLKRDGNIFYITDSINENITEKDIVVTATYPFGSKVNSNIKTKVCPFVYRNDQGRNWEVHIPYEAPTSKMDLSYFGVADDATNINKKNYYTREGNYPFAFYLSGADQTDVAKMLDRKNESIAIDRLYPSWSKWVISNGLESQDWYK